MQEAPFKKILLIKATLLIAAQAYGMGASIPQPLLPPTGQWCYRSPMDRPCGGEPGRCIQNPDGSLGGFVAHTAKVEANAIIGQHARICDHAEIFGSNGSRGARVFGHAEVSENASVYGDAQVYGSAYVYGEAQVYGSAEVFGDAQISGRAHVYGGAQIYGETQVLEAAQVYGDAQIFGTTQISGTTHVAMGRIQSGARLNLVNGIEVPKNPYKNEKVQITDATLGSLSITNPACPICWKEFKAGDLITRPHCDCRSGYCPPCLKDSFQRKRTCPTCRDQIKANSLGIHRLAEEGPDFGN